MNCLYGMPVESTVTLYRVAKLPLPHLGCLIHCAIYRGCGTVFTMVVYFIVGCLVYCTIYRGCGAIFTMVVQFIVRFTEVMGHHLQWLLSQLYNIQGW